MEYVTNTKDPVEKVIAMFKNHPSLLKINELGYSNNNLFFHSISELHISTVINNIDSSKAYQKGNIPTKLLKVSSDISAIVLSSDINQCIYEGNFPENLKKADITPTFKKGDHLLKSNYRAISMLPTL